MEDGVNAPDWSGGVRVMTPDVRRRTRRRQETREGEGAKGEERRRR